MGDGKNVLSMRIAKRAYLFAIRKKLVNTKYFSVKKEKEGIEKLKNIGSIFGAQKAGAMAQKQAGAPSPKNAGGLLSNTLVRTVGIVTLLVVLAFAFLILSIPKAGPSSAVVSAPPKPSVDFSIRDFGVVTVGTDTDKTHGVYTVIGYNTSEVDNATFSVRVYDTMMPQQVFILNYPMAGAVTYDDFRKSLSQSLAQRGISATEINIEDAQTLPESSVLVVPTGYLPSRFLDSDFNLTRLMDNGVVVIYIGQEFDRAIKPDGLLRLGVTANDYEKAGFTGVIFNQGASACSSGFRLDGPRYTVQMREGSVQVIYGCLSSVPIGNGYFIFVPQTLEGGWRENGTVAGEDISDLISDYAWKGPRGTGNISFAAAGDNASGILHRILLPIHGCGGQLHGPLLRGRACERREEGHYARDNHQQDGPGRTLFVRWGDRALDKHDGEQDTHRRGPQGEHPWTGERDAGNAEGQRNS